MNSQKDPSTSLRAGFASIIIITIIVSILGLGGAGYFFWQNQALENKITNLKDEKANIEKEFAVFKVTDLAKENETLRLKLKTTEENLATEKEKTQVFEKDLSVAESKIKTFETNFAKIKSYTVVLDAFNDWQYAPSSLPIGDRSTAKIDVAITALHDEAVSNLWRNIKANFPQAKQTGVFGYEQVILRVMSLIQSLLP